MGILAGNVKLYGKMKDFRALNTVFQSRIIEEKKMNIKTDVPFSPNETIFSQSFPPITLRDYFAGQVLAGHPIEEGSLPLYIARNCYAIADAMLAEREK